MSRNHVEHLPILVELAAALTLVKLPVDPLINPLTLTSPLPAFVPLRSISTAYNNKVARLRARQEEDVNHTTCVGIVLAYFALALPGSALLLNHFLV